MSVKVKKLTVVYEKDDSAFVVELNPEKVGTIVLTLDDLINAQLGLAQTDDDLHFEADKSFPPRTLTTQVSPKPRGQPVILTAADLAANGNDKFGFWWREDGSWFHAM